MNAKLQHLQQQYVSFVRALNTDKLTPKEVIDRVRAKEKTVPNAAYFFDIVYDWLWCEPESLMKRRENGELNELFRPSTEAR